MINSSMLSFICVSLLISMTMSQAPGGNGNGGAPAGNGNGNGGAPAGNGNGNGGAPAGNGTANGTTAGNGTTNGTTNGGNGGGNNCNPFLQVCPNADCMSSANTGTYQVASPNNSAFFFANQPINITWAFTAATNRDRYPSNNVTIYIQKDGTRDWNLWTAVGRGNTSTSLPLPSGVPGTYRIRLLTDDVENAGNNIGHPSSCVDDGFPTAGLSEKFVVLAPQVDLNINFADPFPPNDALNGAMGSKWSSVGFYLSLVIALFVV